MNTKLQDIDNLLSCSLYDQFGNVAFKGTDVRINQEVESTMFSPGRVRTTLIVEGELTQLGHEGSLYNNGPISFDIKYKRKDIIEILKYGQFISVKGMGLIEKTECREVFALDTFCKVWEPSAISQRFSTKRILTLTIQVNGELTVK